jgi:arylsulfatase A-like enzyme
VLNPYPDSEDQSRAALNEIEFIHPESVKLSFKNIQFVHRGTKQSALIKTAGTILIDCYEPDVELAIKARGNLNMHPSEKTQAYRQEVEYMDHQIGRLTDKLKEMNLLDECLIVLVGDHGEGLGEIKTKYGDRYFGHIHYLYGAHTKVPLIFYDPTSVKQAERITEMTSILDVTPTILGRMRWKKKPYHKGRDLFKRKKTRLSILEETYTPEAIYDRFGMLQYPWHMIYTPETQLYELYQLAMDPGEKENMYEQQKHAAEIKKIQEMLIQKASEILKLKIEVKIDEKSLEMLKSLGYIK